jgi:hypothetical protein
MNLRSSTAKINLVDLLSRDIGNLNIDSEEFMEGVGGAKTISCP